MGPRLFRRGDFVEAVACRRRNHASMGPRLFRRGDGGPVYKRDFGQHASMGPRLFRRGDGHRPGKARGGICRFNGATPFQAWRPRRHLRRARKPLKLQWGHAFSGVETLIEPPVSPSWVCFNGATPFQAWRPRAKSFETSQSVYASMGPRLFRRGDYMVTPRFLCRVTCFNGATPFQAWRPDLLQHGADHDFQLQWGHAFSGVETGWH